MKKWFDSTGTEEDVVISTRVRIARNIKDYKFPETINMEEADKLTENILDIFKDNFDENYSFIKIENIDNLDRQNYVESHLISPRLIKKPEYSSFLLKEDETVSIMINEEDHLRVQSLLSGLNIDKAWEIVNDIDDKIEKKLDYAFNENFGYLTSCPTNLGTGLRVSTMVHIPAISVSGYLNSMIYGFNKIGLTVRGIYGEGSKGLGNLYQISNQVTLGENEKTIIEKLRGVIYQVIEKERELREFLLLNRRDDFEDRVFRSYGILENARIVSSKEAMAHISNIRLGMEAGLIDKFNYRDITELIISVQPAHIQKQFDTNLGKKDRDIKRAELIRKFFISKEVK